MKKAWIAAGVLVTAVFIGPLPVMQFNLGSLLGILLGAAFLLYGLLADKLGQRFRSVLLVLLLAVGITALTELGFMIRAVGTAPAENESATVVVLGCRVRGTSPSLMLQERINAAYRYLSGHPDSACVCSGGRGAGEAISEAECIYRGLIARGIAPERLYLEENSTSTEENMGYSADVIRKNSLNPTLALATNEFHCYRALRYAERLGFTAGTLPASTACYLLPTYYVRECCAILQLWSRDLTGAYAEGLPVVGPSIAFPPEMTAEDEPEPARAEETRQPVETEPGQAATLPDLSNDPLREIAETMTREEEARIAKQQNGINSLRPRVELPASEKKADAKQIEALEALLQKKAAHARALNKLESMNLREKVCQMLIVLPHVLAGNATTSVTEELSAALKTYPVGGLMLNKVNISSAAQSKSMIQACQASSNTPLFIASDDEGGVVRRFLSLEGAPEVLSMLSYEEQGIGSAWSNAQTIAAWLKEIGTNLDFAPVADVWSNPDNTVIGRRAYSTDFEKAGSYVEQAVWGFHSRNMACTLKHFPGHGDTAEDSHVGLAYNYKTLDQLRSQEFLSFKAGIEAGADLVMVGHIVVPAVTDVPATFSHTFVTDILRGELGFDGVIVTDSVDMGALKNNYSRAEIAARVVEAGCDIILDTSNVPETVAGLEDAVNSGRISAARINASVLRILELKYRLGLFGSLNTDAGVERILWARTLH